MDEPHADNRHDGPIFTRAFWSIGNWKGLSSRWGQPSLLPGTGSTVLADTPSLRIGPA